MTHDRRSIPRFLALCAFLLPLSAASYSLNYTYGLLAARYPLQTIRRVPVEVQLFAVSSVVSYVIGLVCFSSFDEHFMASQFGSLVVFLLPLLVLFLRVPHGVDEISGAVLAVSLGYALFVLYAIGSHASLGLAESIRLKGDLQAYVSDWPQRYVMLLVYAVFVALRRVRRHPAYLLALLPILVCIGASFTRAAVVALAVGLPAYGLAVLWAWLRHAHVRRIGLSRRTLLVVVLAATGAVTMWRWVDQSEPIKAAFTLFGNTLSAGRLSRGLTRATAIDDVTGQGSEAERLVVWHNAIDWTLSENPLTGAGTAGTSLVLGANVGSAHSEYVDILFRTGFIGLALYLVIWFRTLMFYFVHAPYVFGGLMSLFTYGFFHETTKLSYGGLAFALLANKAYEARTGARVRAQTGRGAPLGSLSPETA